MSIDLALDPGALALGPVRPVPVEPRVVVVAVVAAHDYAQGRTLYTSLASYHAYLEFPVLIALTMAWATGLGCTRDRGWQDRDWMEP